MEQCVQQHGADGAGKHGKPWHKLFEAAVHVLRVNAERDVPWAPVEVDRQRLREAPGEQRGQGRLHLGPSGGIEQHPAVQFVGANGVVDQCHTCIFYRHFVNHASQQPVNREGNTDRADIGKAALGDTAPGHEGQVGRHPQGEHGVVGARQGHDGHARSCHPSGVA